MARNLPTLLVVASTNLGSSLSGGDRIFLNLIRCWNDRFNIKVLGSPETLKLLKKFKISDEVVFIPTTHHFSPVTRLNTLSLIFHHTQRFLTGIVFSLKHRSTLKNCDYIYTASDFWGDFIIGMIAKLFNPKIKWFCGFYLLAPSPLNRFTPYNVNHQYFRGIVYFLAQIPTVFIARRLADYVFITSLPDKDIFGSKSIIVQGGVNLPSSLELKNSPKFKDKIYEAFYLGRLHSQKGVLELIDIWKKVIDTLPQARLIIVGDGELRSELINKISKLGLSKNIILKGFLIGKKKFDLIKKSKVVVHPAIYDSGGMAAAESMAWGLPGVSFDLPALKTYYPKGMVKVKAGDLDAFAKSIIKLLTTPEVYSEYSTKAVELTRESWGWEARFDRIYQIIFKD